MSRAIVPAALLIVVGAYLIGSISFAVVVSRAFGLPDPHEYGSKNPGATNVLRTGNKLAAVLTMLGDGLKGFVAVFAASHLAPLAGAADWTIAAAALAVFIGRFWSSPSRITLTFVIDRRALAKVCALDLTEARVRGAIRVLEDVGYIDRAVMRGSPYQPTPEGLRRKPVEFQFGTDYVPLLVGANRRAAAAHERPQLAGR